jgi:hypothetical protein
MEAEEDISEDLEITIDDSLQQLSLDCESEDKEETEEPEAALHPVSTVYNVEELKSKSDLKVLHERNAVTVFSRYAELGLFHLFCQSLGLKVCFSGPTKAFIRKGRKNAAESTNGICGAWGCHVHSTFELHQGLLEFIHVPSTARFWKSHLT